MLNRGTTTRILLPLVAGAVLCGAGPVWPPAPADPRVEYVGEIRCQDLRPQSGFLGKVAGLLGGRSEGTEIDLPFDIVVFGNRLFMTCQNLAALVEVDLEKGSYKLHDQDLGLRSPISVCRADDSVFMTDSGSATVYRCHNGDLEPWITMQVGPAGFDLGTLPGDRRDTRYSRTVHARGDGGLEGVVIVRNDGGGEVLRASVALTAR